jgi:hypothetical protein
MNLQGFMQDKWKKNSNCTAKAIKGIKRQQITDIYLMTAFAVAK